MPEENLAFKNRSVRMKSVLPESVVSLKNARVEEGLSRLTETRIEFLSSDMQLDLQKVLGTRITLEVDGEDEAQGFSGLCISAEYVGLYQGMLHIVAEVRPWLWMLTRTRNSRIYQEKTAHEIIKSVLSDHGFSADLSDKVQGSYLTRTYCVQYRETDFDFISRLMEEEGIYYYFQQVGDKEKLVLCDDVSAHTPVPG
ncbi:MAG: type VI secretion system Vgr family protein, partial [Pseudooceanicola nanhaiensis]